MNKAASIAILIALSLYSSAQPAEMAEGMRQDGKIYVVIAVIAIVFLALSAYLFYLDRKLRNLEQNSKSGAPGKPEQQK